MTSSEERGDLETGEDVRVRAPIGRARVTWVSVRFAI